MIDRSLLAYCIEKVLVFAIQREDCWVLAKPRDDVMPVRLGLLYLSSRDVELHQSRMSFGDTPIRS